MAVLYKNGVMVTMNGDQTAETLIEKDGRIAMVGSLAQARIWQKAHPQEKLEERDLAGHALLPGFIDPHSHITALAQTVNLVHFDDVSSIGELQRKIKDFIGERQLPEGTWVQGFGYDHNFLTEKRHPTRAELDAVSESHPILIAHASGHMGVVNSAALKQLGIDASTPDPEGGKIGREAGSQKPNGYLEETAFTLLSRGFAAPDLDQLLDQLDQAQEKYLSYGITTVQDGITKRPDWAVLQAMAERKRLKVDVVSYVDLKDNEALIGEHPEYAQGYQNRLRIGGVKIFLDGSPQGRTAWMSEPYLGADSQYCGYPVYTDDQVDAFIDEAMGHHWQLLTHFNGDAAAEQLIRCTQRQQARHPEAAALRPVMIHAQLVRRDQLPRMKALNMTASFFTAHCWYWGDIHLRNFGQPRGGNISPMRWAIDEGLNVTMHQDTPVIMPNMLESVECACRRVTKGGQALNPELRITPLEALQAVTINAAWQYHEEDRKGSLEEGKLADLVILEKNPLSCPAEEIGSIAVLETIKEGVSVYTRK